METRPVEQVRRDRLDGEFRYALRRSPKLTDAECRFLAILGSYEHGCLMNYDEICAMTNWGRTKLKTVISSLKKKNLIEVTYRYYKKTTIRIAAASKQKAFADAESSDGRQGDHQPWPIQRPHMDGTATTHGREGDQSMLEKELERKLETSDVDNSEKGNFIPSRLGDVSRILKQTIKSMNK